MSVAYKTKRISRKIGHGQRLTRPQIETGEGWRGWRNNGWASCKFYENEDGLYSYVYTPNFKKAKNI